MPKVREIIRAVVSDEISTMSLPASTGMSAYDIAVLNGFIGSEAEWLASLKGEAGAPGADGAQGPQGEIGPRGNPGLNGQDGAAGQAGYTPIKGVDYFDGAKGDKGDRGDQGIPGLPGSDASVTKANIEAVLTGEITSHTHPASQGADPWNVIKLGTDFTTSLATNANVTGLAFTPAINRTYLIFGYFLLRTATATVGARPGVAWPSNLTDSIMRMEASTSLTASVIRTWGARSTQNAASTGLASTTDSHWGSLDGIMITSGTTSGAFQITLASETAGTNVTIRAGSVLMYREI